MSAEVEHPSAAHPVGTWRETTYGDWGSRTITRRTCLTCGWSETVGDPFSRLDLGEWQDGDDA